MKTTFLVDETEEDQNRQIVGFCRVLNPGEVIRAVIDVSEISWQLIRQGDIAVAGKCRDGLAGFNRGSVKTIIQKGFEQTEAVEHVQAVVNSQGFKFQAGLRVEPQAPVFLSAHKAGVIP